ncbi:TonB-dependent receptor [Paludibacter jiangxiensis]|uniref:Iron complex outermembrane recepter protein n=1 Tax=Paludibacter jiangxiensis TaxID=681398 RepID=A0A170Y1X8_9BACT|nr:TonB-dependent receptor [Paludibacter jiangxiensis]GAT61440.1 iron complex outermembrane recepter protein [Paludibacter jiangxiensis]
MKKLLLLFGLVCQCALFAQQQVSVSVKDAQTKETLIGAAVTVSDTSTGAVTDGKGVATLNISGTFPALLKVQYVGYEIAEIKVDKPGLQEVLLQPASEHLDEVTVTSVRTNSRIEAIPTRIEVLGLEDTQEENGIMPGNISSLLGDIAGIQMQEVSAASGNTYARIQGLNGRYTQLLKDGLPLYGGLSGNFGIMQVPPLDLKQIEIIKGSCSTLYGGDAIGGIINLVSKDPTPQQELSATINETSLHETNLNAYMAKKYKTFGYTLFAGQTWRQATDVNGDGLSESSRVRSTVIHPKFQFYLDPRSTLTVDYTGTFDNRKGGDMRYLSSGNGAYYHVGTQSDRHSVTAKYVNNLSPTSNITVKASGSNLDQTIDTRDYNFRANQLLYYSELSYFRQFDKMNWVIGANFNGDQFHNRSALIPLNGYSYNTLGGFVQNTYNPVPALTIESGVRVDYQNKYGWFVLPRLSVMYKFSKEWTARVNGGLGYMTPNPLNYIDLEQDLNRLTSVSGLKPERSHGLNADVNFQKRIGDVTINLNQAFFASFINSPVDSLPGTAGVTLYNAPKALRTLGAQTYMRLTVGDWEVYLSYVYTHVNKLYNAEHQQPICTPQHNLSNTMMYELSKNWSVGLENSLVAGQINQDYQPTKAYYIMAAMLKYSAGHLTAVLNGENLMNVRQSRYEPIFDGTFDNPQMRQLWAPIEGRILNLSLTWKL